MMEDGGSHHVFQWEEGNQCALSDNSGSPAQFTVGKCFFVAYITLRVFPGSV